MVEDAQALFDAYASDHALTPCDIHADADSNRASADSYRGKV